MPSLICSKVPESMMNLLLDIHLLIWAMGAPLRLPKGLASTGNLACCAAPWWKGGGRKSL